MLYVRLRELGIAKTMNVLKADNFQPSLKMHLDQNFALSTSQSNKTKQPKFKSLMLIFRQTNKQPIPETNPTTANTNLPIFHIHIPKI